MNRERDTLYLEPAFLISYKPPLSGKHTDKIQWGETSATAKSASKQTNKRSVPITGIPELYAS
jgi:hypothetical protein